MSQVFQVTELISRSSDSWIGMQGSKLCAPSVWRIVITCSKDFKQKAPKHKHLSQIEILDKLLIDAKHSVYKTEITNFKHGLKFFMYFAPAGRKKNEIWRNFRILHHLKLYPCIRILVAGTGRISRTSYSRIMQLIHIFNPFVKKKRQRSKEQKHTKISF